MSVVDSVGRLVCGGSARGLVGLDGWLYCAGSDEALGVVECEAEASVVEAMPNVNRPGRTRLPV